MSKVTLSIITVTYNAEKVLRPTIESVLNQTFRELEYLIIDGKSTDQTPEIIRSYQKKIDQVITEKDEGVYDAMNKGLKLAKGKYVMFLNAGDELAGPSVLENVFSASDDADVYYGETNIINESRQVIGTRSELTSRKLPAQLTKKDFLNGQVVSHQSFIARKSLCKPYDLKYRCSADIDWMLQIVSTSSKIVNVGQPVSNYLKGGISDQNLRTCWRERFVILLKHFGLSSVIRAHIRFAVRFFEFGRYKEG